MITLLFSIGAAAAFAAGYVYGHRKGLDACMDIATQTARAARQGNGEDVYEIALHETALYIAGRIAHVRAIWL